MYNIEICQQPCIRLASQPHHGSYFEIGKVFDQLATIATARNLWNNIQGMVGVYYDDSDSKPIELVINEGAVAEHGQIKHNAADVVAITGLDEYHTGSSLERLAYAKP